MKIFKLSLLGLSLLTAFALTSCDDDPFDFDGIVLGSVSQGGVSAANKLRVEVPASQTGDLFIVHSLPVEIPAATNEDNDTVVNVMTYCLAYDTVKYHSRWVAFRFDGLTRKKEVGRSGSFMDDPMLPSRHYIGSGTFSGYDRGHICASNDVLWSLEANEQTFYMTNMSPQLAQFNQNYWVDFEGWVQQKGRDEAFSDTLYVVKGGTIKDDQIMSYVNRSNGKQVPVPAYYYMALVSCKNNTYQGMAFLMEHKNYGKSANLAEIRSKVVTIDSLETFTGIDFFHNLDDIVENNIEANVNYSYWGL